MKRRSPLSGDAVLLAVLLIVFALLSFSLSAHAPESKDDDLHPRRTTNSYKQGGWKAFYLLLQESTLRPERWTRPPRTWPKDAKLVVSAAPFSQVSEGATWSEDEVDQALAWVSGGGTLIYFGDEENTLTRKLDLEIVRLDSEPGRKTAAPAQPAVLLGGVMLVEVPDHYRWSKAPPRAVSLLGDTAPLALVFHRDAGTIIAVSSPGMADNRHIGDRNNARFLVQLAAVFSHSELGGAGRILFDEYHQGYVDGDSLWEAVGRPGRLAAFQLLILVVLVAYSAGRRFGLPRPLPEKSRISSEYVRSLADLYRRARAGDTALTGLYGTFRRDLCRAIGVAPDTKVDVVAKVGAAALAGGKPDVESRLHELMDSCEAKISGGPRAVPDRELLQVARGLEAMRKELQLGANDRVG